MFVGDFRRGSDWASLAQYPLYPGYSNVGTVIDAGADVDQSLIGTRVASFSRHSRFVVVSLDGEGHRRPRFLPDDVDDEDAAFFTLAEVAMNGIRRGAVTWGESVVVYGLGILGHLVVRLCRVGGARPVVAIDVAQTRLEALPGGTLVVGVNAETDDAADVVKQATKERMADVVFEVTGNPELIPTEVECLRDQGRFVILSSPRGDPTLFDFHDLCNRKSVSIVGAHYYSHPAEGNLDNPWTWTRHAELFFDLLSSGELDLRGLVTHRFSYEDVEDAYAQLAEDRSSAIGVVLTWA
jgi:2-desacetyl-2-hydroxyethyl bacteriochlorophyllide A dehydrogenase